MNIKTSILDFWLGHSLPKEHTTIKNYNPRDYFTKWLWQPIKRHVARLYLMYLRKTSSIMVIGITGSAGKTTTKEMLAAILRLRGNSVYSKDNIDPVYNIPNTIFKCNGETKFLILEMGVEYPGEMDFYLWMVKPDVGVITNIYPTHTEYFENEEGVLKEKSKLVKSISSGGIAVLNFEDGYLKRLNNKISAQIVWYGTGGSVLASSISYKGNRTQYVLSIRREVEMDIKITLPTMGQQFISNSLAAAAVSLAIGTKIQTIRKGLATYGLPPHRMAITKHSSGALIVDDSYNNNPVAAKEAISTFLRLSNKKKKVIVFGDMLELGKNEAKYHKAIGALLGKENLEKLICVGSVSRFTAEAAGKMLGEKRVVKVPTYKEAMVEVQPYLRSGYAILIKGSRSIKLDLLVSHIMG